MITIKLKKILEYIRGNPSDLVVNVLACDIGVSKFKLQSRYCVHFLTRTFEKGMNSLSPSHLLNSTTAFLLTRRVLALNNPSRLICKKKVNLINLVLCRHLIQARKIINLNKLYPLSKENTTLSCCTFSLLTVTRIIK